MDYSNQKISDLFDALPESVQMCIYDGPLDNELADIADKYKISEIDLEKIKSEVLLVILSINKQEALEQTFLQKTSVDKQNVKKICNDLIQRIILPLAAEHISEENHDKKTILNEIENPVPTKPLVFNPAGKNPILDAQHNLPEQEHKVLISSASVPSRGPILNNFKTSFATVPTMPKTPAVPVKPITSPIQPAMPKPVVPAVQQQSIPPKPITPPVQPSPIPKPSQPQPIQPPKPVQAPIPPAPKKYTVDPYREPIE